MVAKVVVFVLSAAIVVSSGVAQDVVPLVLWHGIGGSCCDPHHLGQLIALIEKEVPGIYIHSISFGKNPTEDVFFSFYGLLSDQVSQVCDALANDTRLANGFNAMGFGQGGLFLRALVQRCGKVRVRNLISVGGPQQGSYGLPYCPGNNASLCRVVHHTVMKHGVYTPGVQKLITVAQYWQDPKYEEKYEKDCIFLPDLNQMNVTNPVYKERIVTLTNFVLVKLELDRVVNPTESEVYIEKEGEQKRAKSVESSLTSFSPIIHPHFS
ncbi:Palmitoyl-protein thioesterase 1 [Geodia barretti]|uniref:Palmitoyl-protein thioesterase 1 n=1 Tax=Geodia barretti TaxID=519541 RepID=A0AA35RHS0_GEOBA|nr:Palmitoyl-protein thioesterase 1 [Geodia barretti]